MATRRLLLSAGVLPALALALPRVRAQAALPGRTALVIGNAAYAAAPLRNPVNDARLVSSSLRQIGYAVVHHEDLHLQPMIDALREWITRSAAAQSRLLYFAGHGAQYRGKNFLLPVDALLRDESDLLQRAVNGSDIVDRLSRAPSGVNIIVLDACRSASLPLDPSVARIRSRDVALSGEGGFAPELSPKGTLIAYSTSPGATALDGAEGNSAYTRHFVAQMSVPGVPIESVFKRVRNAVARETGNRQVPWEHSSLVGEFCLRPGQNGQCGPGGGTDTAVDLSRNR